MQKAVMQVGVAVALCAMVTGCASIVKGTKESVGVSSSPIGTTFTVEGMTYTTPAMVKLSRNKDHVITFEKEGYEPAAGTIRSGVSPWWLGNVVFIYGAPIGMLVDFANGAT